jgi:hypothetical protein
LDLIKLDKRTSKVPRAAAWLGGLGLLPFAICASALFVGNNNLTSRASFALVTYGAIILSFLGGIHWGLAIDAESKTGRNITCWLILSVSPSLVAWAALLVPTKIGCLVLAAALVAMLWVDVLATRARKTPPWYLKLRLPLSLAATSAVLVGSLM